MKVGVYEKTAGTDPAIPSVLACFCHDAQVNDVFKVFFPENRQAVGFIAFAQDILTAQGKETRPHWCPKMLRREPMEIDHFISHRILANCTTRQCADTYRPLGLFYYRDGEIYIGIDNSTGDALFEEFASKRACLKWLYAHDVPYYLL